MVAEGSDADGQGLLGVERESLGGEEGGGGLQAGSSGEGHGIPRGWFCYFMVACQSNESGRWASPVDSRRRLLLV